MGNVNNIEEHRSKIIRNRVFQCQWQSKTLFLSIFDPRLSIVKSVFDCRLPCVVLLTLDISYLGNTVDPGSTVFKVLKLLAYNWNAGEEAKNLGGVFSMARVNQFLFTILTLFEMSHVMRNLSCYIKQFRYMGQYTRFQCVTKRKISNLSQQGILPSSGSTGKHSTTPL